MFVRPDDSNRAVLACWSADAGLEGAWETLRFCDDCPDPEVCGYVDRVCRLTNYRHPQTTFAFAKDEVTLAEASPFGDMLKASACGKLWLNQINTAFTVLNDLHARTWQIHCARLAGDIGPVEARFRQHLEERWTTAIFEGRNPLFAVLPWNTDPKQLRAHLIKKYFIEDQGADPEEAPAPDEAIAAVITACADAVSFELEQMLEAASEDEELPEHSLKKTLDALADDAASHVKVLLGLPDEVQVKVLPQAVKLRTPPPRGRRQPREC